MRRLLALAALAGLLGGCNMVVTTTPIFSRTAEAGGPGLRPGLWSNPKDASCTFDGTAPLTEWPECAHGAIIGDGAISGYDKKDGQSVRQSFDYILAAGRPPVLQIHVVQPASDAGPARSVYVYGGMRVDKLDERGRITGLTTWLTLCGPPPPQNATLKGQPRYGSLKPLPGLVMDEDGNDCTTTSPEALRRAAQASQAWADEPSTLRWVRDGDH
jgi:hypothetical protein